MTTATRSDWTLPLVGGRYHFLLRRLHSLTGILFGGYILVHLFVNATIAQGGVAAGHTYNIYQAQVNKIHELPLLALIEWTFIYLPIIYHIIYGVWITITGQPNVVSYPYARNWLYIWQRITAMYLIFFILFHVISFKYGWLGESLRFRPNFALSSVARHMDVSFFITWIIYPLGIVATCFHLANGFFTAAITWGLTVSAGAQKRWGLVCVVIFMVTMIAGFAALIGAAAQDPVVLLETGQ